MDGRREEYYRKSLLLIILSVGSADVVGEGESIEMRRM